MTTPRNGDPNPSAQPAADDEVFYPTNDAEQMWLISEQVKELVKQTLAPDQSELLLPKLERLFQNWSIYPPG